MMIRRCIVAAWMAVSGLHAGSTAHAGDAYDRAAKEVFHTDLAPSGGSASSGYPSLGLDYSMKEFAPVPGDPGLGGGFGFHQSAWFGAGHARISDECRAAALNTAAICVLAAPAAMLDCGYQAAKLSPTMVPSCMAAGAAAIQCKVAAGNLSAVCR